MVKLRDIFTYIGILCLAAAAVFESQLILIGGTASLIFVYVFALLAFLAGRLRSGRLKIARNLPGFLKLLLLTAIFMLNAAVNGEMLTFVRLLVYICFIFLAFSETDWLMTAKKLLFALSFTAVIATILFYVFPQLYSFVYKFYGYFPPGTGSIANGYRAGLSSHYSQNGIFIAIALMISACEYLANSRGAGANKRSKWKSFFFAACCVVAFILNGKRGSIIWSILAIGCVCFFISRDKAATIWKVLLAVGILLVLMQLLSESVPQIETMIERFGIMGNDQSSLHRLAMWSLAITEFCRAPVLGIGFLNYRESYDTHLAPLFATGSIADSRLDAHNIYLQVLCETGAIGFIVFMSFVLLALITTIKLAGYYSERKKELRLVAILSLCIQIYFVLYGLSGNGLYDLTFCFYAFSLAMSASLYIQRRRERKGIGQLK